MMNYTSDVACSSSVPPRLSINSLPLKNYEVFISYRGKDTRYNFTNYLYTALCRKGIATFVDDKLARGDTISTLFPTIENSKFALIIFSRNYAFSKWCLDELVKILECKETHGQIVIPVFYNVDPSDVKYQTGSYAESFVEHARKQIPEMRRKKWRNTLREASLLSGWDTAVTR